ncbi:15889_t:CDS:1, partial [Gigaspora margarita]
NAWKDVLVVSLVVIPLDRFVARDSFQYIRLNDLPISVCDQAIILDSCGQYLEGGLATFTIIVFS